MGSEDHTVYVVDDDVRMCEALRELFTSLGVTSVTFGSVAEYIAYQKPDLPACLILDVDLPDISRRGRLSGETVQAAGPHGGGGRGHHA